MRIISGHLGGRKIKPPSNNWPTRPTTDFAREALFNILDAKIDWPTTSMLDLFGGTGMVTLEAASRGCADITYIDRHRPCVQWVKQISGDLGISSNITIRPFDVRRFIKSQKKKSTTFDFIFADPPYDWLDMHKLSDMILDAGLLAERGLLVIEHRSTTNLSTCPHWLEDRKYGSSTFSFFAASSSSI